jgi:hypothetical protein
VTEHLNIVVVCILVVDTNGPDSKGHEAEVSELLRNPKKPFAIRVWPGLETIANYLELQALQRAERIFVKRVRRGDPNIRLHIFLLEYSESRVQLLKLMIETETGKLAIPIQADNSARFRYIEVLVAV